MEKKILLVVFLFLVFSLTGCDGLYDYRLDVDYTGEGKVSLSPSMSSYPEGTKVTLTALPAPGYFFLEWQGDLTGSMNPVTITMDSNKRITASFLKFSFEEGDLKIHVKDLSSGSGSITLNAYEEKDNAFVILFPLDDLGGFHSVSSLRAEQEGASSSFPMAILPSLRKEATFPFRDRLSLRELEKEMLKNHSSASKIEPLLSIQSDRELHSLETFNVILEGDIGDDVPVEARLQAKGDNYLLWVATSQHMSETTAKKIGRIYEETIQPMVTQYFGDEPDSSTFPVLAGSCERVNLLFVPLVDVGGYFYAADLYAKNTYDLSSNECKILYILYEGEDEDFDYMMGTIAHELQHMIFYHESVQANRSYLIDDIWINEGFSQLAEDLTGYGYEQGTDSYRVDSFALKPHYVSLINWEGDYPDYGVTYLFARYLYDRYGFDIISTISRSPQDPKLAQKGKTGLDFPDLFRDFGITLLLHQMEGIPSEYTFRSIDFPMAFTHLNPGSSWTNKQVKGWGLYYTVIGPGNGQDLTIIVDGASTIGKYRMIVVERRGE